jgi:hypothetical protein
MRGVVVGEWQGSIHGDLRSFAWVVRYNPAPMVRMNPRPTRGWGRGGFGSDHGARGQRGMVWFQQGAGAPRGGRGGNPPHQGGRRFVPVYQE